MKAGILRWAMVLMVSVLAILAVSPVSSAITKYQPSSWAVSKIEIAGAAGIIPEGFDTQPFTGSITRLDFCKLLIRTCQVYGYKLPETPAAHPFTDTQDVIVEQAYVLGIISGRGDGSFSPDQPLTREMAAVMLSRLRMLLQSAADRAEASGSVFLADSGVYTYSPPLDDRETAWILEEYSSDSKKLSWWARPYMADVYSRGILVGAEGNRINPGENLKREQAVALALYVLAYCDESRIRAAGVDECVLPAPSGIYISQFYNKGDVILNWNEIPSASAYNVTIYNNSVAAYTASISDPFLDLRPDATAYDESSGPDKFTNDVNQFYNTIFDGKKQSVSVVLEVVPVNSAGEPSIFSLRREFTVSPWINENEMIYGDPAKNSFGSAAEASLNMTSIKVKVWNLSSSGTKTTKTITLTVNKNVAENVKKIFEDIYNGKEKFPIKTCSGYAYRKGTSQHSAGIAIDINSDENYFIGSDGAIKAGKLYSPYNNPYSIPQDGDVVRAFNRYGWRWSPDMNWSNGADYMHFSLMGT